MKKHSCKAELNTLCQRCANDCKQMAHLRLIKCPRFEASPQQLEIPLFKKSRPRTKAS